MMRRVFCRTRTERRMVKLRGKGWREVLVVTLGTWIGKGGRHGEEKIAMACAQCDSSRGDTPPLDWIAERGGVMPAADGCVRLGSHATARTFDFVPPPARPAPLTRKQRAAIARERMTG
jgi:hypothetical protein